MKATIISVITALALIGGVIFFGESKGNEVYNGNNITIENGIQIIEIQAKGGYTPQNSMAKANIPTILRFKTNGTFDCSSSVRIPSMGISKVLPQTGDTDIDIGVQKISTLKGSCGMGMYPFGVVFN